jgi:CheY-like chemotaxis protein
MLLARSSVDRLFDMAEGLAVDRRHARAASGIVRRRRNRSSASRRDRPGRRIPRAGRSRRPFLILIVEDARETRDMYTDFLTFCGYRVAQADDGIEALDRAAALHPDLIVMDLALPRLSGWEATERLKSNPRTRRIPVIAITGFHLNEYQERAMAAGCSAFMTKPCVPDLLLAEITRQLPDSGEDA